VSLWKGCHVLELFQLRIQKVLLHLASGTRLLKVCHVLLTVLRSALDHNELNPIHLLIVVISDPLYHLAFLQVPNNQGSVFRA